MARAYNLTRAGRSIDDELYEVIHIEDIDQLNTGPYLSVNLLRVNSHSEDSHGAQFSTDLRGRIPTQSHCSPNHLTTAQMTASSPRPQRTGVSPSSSPRLPSPPPFTEVQIGPKSPTIGEGPEHQLGEAAKQNDDSTRRIRPGTKAADMASGPPLIPLADVLESPFQLQEHLKALYHTYTRGPSDTTTPITRQTALTLSTPPIGIDKPLWLYELCRFLTMKANNLIVAFFADTPPCSANTCAEMRASEWQYLCAVHDPPKSCCAIDYCCHTLDWAANILTSPKYFPSRLTLGGDMAGGGAGSQASMRHLTNIFRRVYRIFAHAWFQHTGVFWQVEGHEGLYVFFKTVCDVYQLIPEDNYTIPVEAECGDGDSMETPVENKRPEIGRIHLLKKNQENGQGCLGENFEGEVDATTTVSVGATTRRHKHTPSTGSHVTTIAEGLEDEEPSANENGTEQSLERSESPRNRSKTPSEDLLASDLGKLNVGELSSAASNEQPAEQPTPQPQTTERNPMDDLGTSQMSNDAVNPAAAGAAPDVGGEAEEEEKEGPEPTPGTDGLSEVPATEQKNSVEPASEVKDEDEDGNDVNDTDLATFTDYKEEKPECQTQGS